MTKVNPNIFRAYDIRGIAEKSEKYPNPDLTPETAKLIGLGTATYLKRKYGTKNMIIGRDNRHHSEQIQAAFIDGVTSIGIDVTNIELSTSPLLYYSTCYFNFDSGVNITASHNPKEYNGIKIIRTGGASVADNELQEILKIIQNGDFDITSESGSITNKTDTFENYLDFVSKRVKLARPLKVVVDCGNGVAGPFAPKLLKQIGCEVTELFCDLDGNFPNHEANPEEAENMIDLGKKVVEIGADLGIGFDGDGDRVGIVDHTGKHYPAEYLIMLLSREFLRKHPGEKVIFDVKVSKNLINDISNSGGLPIMSKTGHSFIEEKLKHENASLAGENSGHIFFGKKFYDYYGFDDATFAACKIVETLSNSEKTFPEHFETLPKLFSTPEIKVSCPDDRKFEIVKEITEFFKQNYDCITIDGVRINFDENSWGAIRCSNTTPKLTLRIESDTPEKLEQYKNMIFKKLSEYPEINLN